MGQRGRETTSSCFFFSCSSFFLLHLIFCARASPPTTQFCHPTASHVNTDVELGEGPAGGRVVSQYSSPSFRMQIYSSSSGPHTRAKLPPPLPPRQNGVSLVPFPVGDCTSGGKSHEKSSKKRTRTPTNEHEPSPLLTPPVRTSRGRANHCERVHECGLTQLHSESSDTV